MILVLKNHSEEYAAREMISAHIPKIKIEVSNIIPKSGDYIISEVVRQKDIYTYTATLSLDSKIYSFSVNSDCENKIYVKKTINEVFKEALGTVLPWGLITGIRPSKMVRELLGMGRTKSEIKSHFDTYFECSPDKSNLAIEVANNEKKLIDTILPNSISLYIGIPFCPTRCLYCSFTSQSIKFSGALTEEYMDALCKEMHAVAEIIRNNMLKIDTVYIGGGTPTSLNESQLERLLNTMEECFDLSSIREFTLEAGRPDTINDDKLRIIRNHGISRISINPQTMNQKTLDIIGRRHTPEDIIRTYDMAVKHGFSHINADLIAGLPEETEYDFEHTLREMEKLNPQSITVHTMSIKRGSYLDEKYSMYTPTASKTVNNMLAQAHECMMNLNKLPYYMYRQKNMLGNLENVGYCDKGHECLYNIYIMEEVQTIYALGAGSSTKIIDGSKIDRIFNVKEVSEYINRIDEMIARKDILKNMPHTL